MENRARTRADLADFDDQNTLTSLPPPYNASEERSVFSDSNTIGDFEVRGYVNRCPRFQSGRTITFASIVLSKGFFAWDSSQAFDTFIENRRKLDKCLEDGIGWPMFHYVSSGLKSFFDTSKPVNKVYKYKVVDIDDADSILEPNKELVVSNKVKALYKVEYCNVFRNVDNRTGTVRHRFEYINPDGSLYIVTMLNIVGRRHTDFQFFEPVTGSPLNFRWLGITGYTSVFGANDFKLVVLDDETPNLTSSHPIEMIRQTIFPDSNTTRRRPASMPVWGSYARANSLLPIPKRRVFKLAIFEVGEVEYSERSPFSTDVFTCMAMYLHEMEARKERRSPTGRRSLLRASNIGMATGVFL